MRREEKYPSFWGTSSAWHDGVAWSDYMAWPQRLTYIISDYWEYLQKRENNFVRCPFMKCTDTPNHKRTFIQKENKKVSPLCTVKKFNNPYKVKKIWPKINIKFYL